MSHLLADLGYSYDALEPFIDTKTMEIHHTKHHQTYIDKLNAAIKGHDDLEELPVDKLVTALDKVPEAIRTAVRNHGGGHSNHSFFWPTLKKDVAAKGPAVEAITKKFGSFDAFRETFSSAATLLFGSGWAWLCLNGSTLVLKSTANQDSPLMEGAFPVMGLDVWEHAYYLKYQNRRPEYVEAFWNLARVHARLNSAPAYFGPTTLEVVPHRDTFAKDNLLTRGQEIAVEVDEASAAHGRETLEASTQRAAGLYHNTAVVFDADGSLRGTYRKQRPVGGPQREGDGRGPGDEQGRLVLGELAGGVGAHVALRGGAGDDEAGGRRREGYPLRREEVCVTPGHVLERTLQSGDLTLRAGAAPRVRIPW